MESIQSLFALAAIIATPDVDLSVGTTRVALTTVVPSCASERGLFVGAEKTLLLVSSSVTSVPEVHVLDTSRGESLGTRLGVPADIMDFVGITLLLEDALTILVVDVDLMFVVKINGSDPAIGIDSASSDTTGTLGNLNSLFLGTSVSIPSEDGRLGTNLTRDGCGAVGADANAHNIIGMVILIIGNILGSVLNFTTTEESLSVGCSVKDNTESSGHVDGLSTGIEVDVLLGVSASVTIDVFEIVLSCRRISVDGVMIVWLNNLSDPGADRHELFTLSLFYLEEVIFTAIVVFTTIRWSSCTTFLVVDKTFTVVHVGVVGKSAWSSSAGGSTAHCSLIFVCKKINYKVFHTEALYSLLNLYLN